MAGLRGWYKLAALGGWHKVHLPRGQGGTGAPKWSWAKVLHKRARLRCKRCVLLLSKLSLPTQISASGSQAKASGGQNCLKT